MVSTYKCVLVIWSCLSLHDVLGLQLSTGSQSTDPSLTWIEIIVRNTYNDLGYRKYLYVGSYWKVKMLKGWSICFEPLFLLLSARYFSFPMNECEARQTKNYPLFCWKDLKQTKQIDHPSAFFKLEAKPICKLFLY